MPTNPPNPHRLAYSYAEAAALVGVSTWTIRRMVDAGELGKVKFGRSVRIPRQSLLDYMAGESPEKQQAEKPCQSKGKTAPIGGSATPMRAAKELGNLLELPTTKRHQR